MDWYSLVPTPRRTVCYFSTAVFLYHTLAIIIMLICWKYVNKRIILYSSIVLFFGFSQYAVAQILCYVDYIVDFMKCTSYARSITILGDVQHLAFDIYQMRKIIPLIGSMVENPLPLAIISWIFFVIRVGCAITKNVVQQIIIAPPEGGFTQPDFGLCTTFNNPQVLIAVRIGSFLFELVLFMELIYIMKRLRNGPNHQIETDTSRTTHSIGRFLDVELTLFVVYFIMDLVFLIILLLQNISMVIPFATMYQAVLPTIIIANVLCSRWIAKQRELDGHPRSSDMPSTTPTFNSNALTTNQSTSPVHGDSELVDIVERSRASPTGKDNSSRYL